MGILYDVTVSHPIILPVITRLSLWHNGMQKYSSTTEYSVCRDFYAVPSPTDERTDMTSCCAMAWQDGSKHGPVAKTGRFQRSESSASKTNVGSGSIWPSMALGLFNQLDQHIN